MSRQRHYLDPEPPDPAPPSRVKHKPTRPSKRRVANAVLAFALVSLTLFTIAMTVAFFITGTEAPTLITAVYGFWGLELISMLVKRIFDKKNSKEESTND